MPEPDILVSILPVTGKVMIVGSHPSAALRASFEHITATNQSTSYYMFGGPRLRGDDGVAMRVAGVVYWLHDDHLGSASLTTSITGTKVSELRYLPFGETRWAWGTTPTDRRYTGQRELAGVGLYDYNARMYWPAAGRFVSADTVVPGPGNPQAFNRFSYGMHNPLGYIDPSGHLACTVSWAKGCHAAASSLRDYALSVRDLVKMGKLQPVEGLAMISDRAMEIFENDLRGYMWGMTNVLIGVDPNKSSVWTRQFKARLADTLPGLLKSANPNNNPYFAGLDLLPYTSGGQNARGDWNPAFYDESNNQAFHFWFYVASAYYDGNLVASEGNKLHDPVTPGRQAIGRLPIIGPALVGAGASVQDHLLGRAGVVLGVALSDFVSKNQSPTYGYSVHDPSKWIRTVLKPPTIGKQ